MNIVLLSLLGLGTACNKNTDTMDSKQTAMSIVRIDTKGVVIDERIEDRSWVDVNLELIHGSTDNPAELDGTVTWSGHGAMHIRGNSSVDYEKKQYALETLDEFGEDLDISPFGMPEEEDWVLHAPYSDKTLMRNHLMYTWSRAIGRYAARTHFVEVYMEDEGGEIGPEDYRGVYVFMEKIKRDGNRIDIDKMSDTDNTAPEVTGGYVLRRDWIEREPIITEIFEDELLLEYPKPEKVTDAQLDWITDYLNRFEDSLIDDDIDPASLADLDSFADYLLLIELSRNVDGYVLSTYMHKPRQGLLTMGPVWDFNGSLGNADYFESFEIEGWHYENSEFPADNPNGFHWYATLLEDPNFRQRVSQRWNEHRAGPWSNEQLIADIDETVELLQEAQVRNFYRWPVLGEYIWPNDFGAEERSSYEEEIEYLKEWLLDRTAWLDQELSD